MPTGEFDLIAEHLTALGAARADVLLGVGDDAALLKPAVRHESRCACLCVTLATLPADEIPAAVNGALQTLIETLRDEGFTPAWATLALTLSAADGMVVQSIARALHTQCLAQGIAVIGGDTTAGDASLSIFLTGLRYR